VTRGVDTDRPLDGRALVAAGYGFAMRYLSSVDPAKVIRRTEVDGLHGAGASVGLVYEDGTMNMAGGAAAGVHDATVAAFEARVLGAPPGTVVYMACDTPTPPNGTREYMTAAGPILQANGCARGFYGNPDAGRMMIGGGLVDAVWAVSTWGSRNLAGCAIVQLVGQSVTIGGVPCDVDELLGPAAGLWAPPPAGAGPPVTAPTPPSVAPSPPMGPPTVTSPTLTAGLPNLFRGAAGGYVSCLQRIIRLSVAGVVVDGAFGVETDTAVRVFQRVHALVVDGVVGPATWAALLTT
jgi:peptidoglycan hydrolase-like protein with peptidoglycan-binding domain